MRILAFLTGLACLSSASFAAPLPFTGSFSYTVGAGERCDLNLYDPDLPRDLGCYAVTNTWDTVIALDSATNASLSGDDLTIFGGSPYLPSIFTLHVPTVRGSFYNEYGPGGGQAEMTFNGTTGSFTFYDDDYYFGTITRPITDVVLTLEFAPLVSADPLPTPLPASLPLVLGGMALLGASARRRKGSSAAQQ